MSRTKTYGEACEELGGRPWRSLDGTEQWFLLEDEDAAAAPRPLTIDPDAPGTVTIDPELAAAPLEIPRAPTIDPEAGIHTDSFRIPSRGLFQVVNWRWMMVVSMVAGMVVAGAVASGARPAPVQVAIVQAPPTTIVLPPPVAPTLPAAKAVAAAPVAKPAVARTKPLRRVLKRRRRR